jgi:hypothetical protein
MPTRTRGPAQGKPTQGTSISNTSEPVTQNYIPDNKTSKVLSASVAKTK